MLLTSNAVQPLRSRQLNKGAHACTMPSAGHLPNTRKIPACLSQSPHIAPLLWRHISVPRGRGRPATPRGADPRATWPPSPRHRPLHSSPASCTSRVHGEAAPGTPGHMSCCPSHRPTLVTKPLTTHNAAVQRCRSCRSRVQVPAAYPSELARKVELLVLQRGQPRALAAVCHGLRPR